MADEQDVGESSAPVSRVIYNQLLNRCIVLSTAVAVFGGIVDVLSVMINRRSPLTRL